MPAIPVTYQKNERQIPVDGLRSLFFKAAPSPITHPKTRKVYDIALASVGSFLALGSLYFLSNKKFVTAAVSVLGGGYLIETAYLTHKQSWMIAAIYEHFDSRFQKDGYVNAREHLFDDILIKTIDLGGDKYIKDFFGSGKMSINTKLSRKEILHRYTLIVGGASKSSLLMHAVRLRNSSLVKALLKVKHIDVESIENIVIKGLMTPLGYACMLGNYEMVKALLDHGAEFGSKQTARDLRTDGASELSWLFDSSDEQLEDRIKIVKLFEKCPEKFFQKEEDIKVLFSTDQEERLDLKKWIFKQKSFVKFIFSKMQKNYFFFDISDWEIFLGYVFKNETLEKEDFLRANINPLNKLIKNSNNDLFTQALNSGFSPLDDFLDGKAPINIAFQKMIKKRDVVVSKNIFLMLDHLRANKKVIPKVVIDEVIKDFASIPNQEMSPLFTDVLYKILSYPKIELSKETLSFLIDCLPKGNQSHEKKLFKYLINHYTLPQKDAQGVCLVDKVIAQGYQKIAISLIQKGFEFNQNKIFDFIDDESRHLTKIYASKDLFKAMLYSKYFDIEEDRVYHTFKKKYSREDFEEAKKIRSLYFSENKEEIAQNIEKLSLGPKTFDLVLFKPSLFLKIPLEKREKLMVAHFRFHGVNRYKFFKKKTEFPKPLKTFDWEIAKCLPEDATRGIKENSKKKIVNFFDFLKTKKAPPGTNNTLYGLPAHSTDKEHYDEMLGNIEVMTKLILEAELELREIKDEKALDFRKTIYNMLANISGDCGANFYQNLSAVLQMVTMYDEIELDCVKRWESSSNLKLTENLSQDLLEDLEKIFSPMRVDIAKEIFNTLGNKIPGFSQELSDEDQRRLNQDHLDDDEYDKIFYLAHRPHFLASFLKSVKDLLKLPDDIDGGDPSAKDYYDIMLNSYDIDINIEDIIDLYQQEKKKLHVKEKMLDSLDKRMNQDYQSLSVYNKIFEKLESTLEHKVREETYIFNEDGDEIEKINLFWPLYLLREHGYICL